MLHLLDIWWNLRLFILGLMWLFTLSCFGLPLRLGYDIYVWVMPLLSFLKCRFPPVESFWFSFPRRFIFLCEQMVWLLQVFWMYSPFEMVQWFYRPPVVVQECAPLVVLSALHFMLTISVPPLDVHQDCSVRLETGLHVFFGISTGFTHVCKLCFSIGMY